MGECVVNANLATRQWGRAQRRKAKHHPTKLLRERDAALKEARGTIQFLREQNARLATRNREMMLIAGDTTTYKQLWEGINALPKTTAKTQLLRIMIGKPPIETKKGQD